METIESARNAENVRSLERGLNLIRLMNEDPYASVTALSRRLAIPRSTVYRLLETLQSSGYVRLRKGAPGYRLTSEVHRLSSGYPEEDWLNDSWHELVKLGNSVFWPLSLFTFDAGMMAIQRTTHERSSMSVDHGMRGRRMPMTESAAGRAYLAFCPPQERGWILGLPEVAERLPTVADQHSFEQQTRKIAHDGYALRIGGLMPNTSSMSVPAMQGSRVLCCISIVWITDALSLERAINDMVGPLKRVAASIAGIAARNARSTS